MPKLSGSLNPRLINSIELASDTGHSGPDLTDLEWIDRSQHTDPNPRN